MDPLPRRTMLLALAASGITSAVWAGLAWRTPTSTFHFAPLIAGAIGPYMAKSSAGPLALRLAGRVAAASAAVVATAIAILLTADKLEGPTFWSDDGAGIEAVLFAGIGLAIGIIYLLVSTRDATTDSPPASG